MSADLQAFCTAVIGACCLGASSVATSIGGRAFFLSMGVFLLWSATAIVIKKN